MASRSEDTSNGSEGDEFLIHTGDAANVGGAPSDTSLISPAMLTSAPWNSSLPPELRFATVDDLRVMQIADAEQTLWHLTRWRKSVPKQQRPNIDSILAFFVETCDSYDEIVTSAKKGFRWVRAGIKRSKSKQDVQSFANANDLSSRLTAEGNRKSFSFKPTLFIDDDESRQPSNSDLLSMLRK